MALEIRVDDLSGPEIAELIGAHKALMLAHSPPESSHALLLDGLRSDDITVWTMWDGDALQGCGALKMLGDGAGEIKSMHTRAELRGSGRGKAMLDHILEAAQARGLTALYLETGSMAAFKPAQRLYERAGFTFCPPFADYAEDPNSVFMCKFLSSGV